MYVKSLAISKSHKRKTGNIVIILLITLVPILGFGALAVDYGVLVNDKNRMQRACDASALAAAQELKVSGDDNADTNNARTIAVATAAQNGVTIASNDVSFSDNNSKVTVVANLQRGLFFARVLGIVSGDTGAAATAGANGPPSNYSGAPYVVPIGIIMEDYDKYKFEGTHYSPTGNDFTLIRGNKQSLGNEELVLFDLSEGNQGKSKTRMVNQLLGIDRQTVTVYNLPYPEYDEDDCTSSSCQQSLNASPAAQVPAFQDGFDTLISKAAGAPWNDNTGNNGTDLSVYNDMVNGVTDYSNPRVINLLITDPAEAHGGNSMRPIRAFVPVYVVGYTVAGQGNGMSIDVHFLFLPTQSNLDPDLQENSGGTSGISLLN